MRLGSIMNANRDDIRLELGLRPVINASGTMTYLGASIVVPEAIEAMARVLPQFVEIGDLQRKASAVIARLTGAEAGTVTACTASGITVAIAGCMTGADIARIEQLPDTSGMRHDVAIQRGHMVNYGAPVEQAVRLSGAFLRPFGAATDARTYQLCAALRSETAAALYVVSHHCVDYGQIPLEQFCAICHEQGVPVIVDAASEYDLTGFLAKGADIVVYSGHKFLGGPTSGIVAGRKDLVRAAYLQNFGIGRGMKVGKESIVGLIATLEAWERRDHAAVRTREDRHLALWRARLEGRPGIRAEILPDPTDNPLDRLRVHVDPAAAGVTAWDLATALAAGDPPVIVRDHHAENGFFDLDPCNLHDGEAEIAADQLTATLARGLAGEIPMTRLADRRSARFERMLAWPD
jgi:D-glucosaminate-6-phosphate ammonia-lyase